MAQMTIMINGYSHTVGCEDGQEAHLQAMAREVEKRVDSIKALGGQSGEARLLVLAALLMADELHDQAIVLDKARASVPEEGKRRRLRQLTERAETIATDLEQP